MGVGQVPADGVGAGVQARGGELVAELEDEFDGLGGYRGRAGVGSTGAGLERGFSLGAVAGDELADPTLGDAVAAGDFGLLAVLEDDGSDDQTGL